MLYNVILYTLNLDLSIKMSLTPIIRYDIIIDNMYCIVYLSRNFKLSFEW